MRLLHTSDWHLGQSLHNFERHYEHQRFLDWLLDTVVSERADALLIADDGLALSKMSPAISRASARSLTTVSSSQSRKRWCS